LVQEERDTTRDTTRPRNTSEHKYIRESNVTQIPLYQHMDNQSAIQVARNPEHHGRMKHLNLHYFWLRDEVVKGHLAPRYIPTAEMAADILTKALARVKVETAREQLGLFPIPKDLRA
jgi:hypothetical protein